MDHIHEKTELHNGREKDEAWSIYVIHDEAVSSINRDIVKFPIPIDFYSAYSEYHNGVFPNIT